MKSDFIPINPTIIRVMRVLRIARVLKLLKMAKGIRALLDTVMQALPQVGNLGLLFFLLFFIFAALGVELFGRLECDDEHPCQGLGEHAHFKNFGMAFLTLFRVATGDNWNGIMKDTLRDKCDDSPDCVKNCCLYPFVAPIFFVVFVLMAQFVLVNVVVAVLMKHLEESHKLPPDARCKDGVPKNAGTDTSDSSSDQSTDDESPISAEEWMDSYLDENHSIDIDDKVLDSSDSENPVEEIDLDVFKEKCDDKIGYVENYLPQKHCTVFDVEHDRSYLVDEERDSKKHDGALQHNLDNCNNLNVDVTKKFPECTIDPESLKKPVSYCRIDGANTDCWVQCLDGSKTSVLFDPLLAEKQLTCKYSIVGKKIQSLYEPQSSTEYIREHGDVKEADLHRDSNKRYNLEYYEDSSTPTVGIKSLGKRNHEYQKPVRNKGSSEIYHSDNKDNDFEAQGQGNESCKKEQKKTTRSDLIFQNFKLYWWHFIHERQNSQTKTKSSKSQTKQDTKLLRKQETEDLGERKRVPTQTDFQKTSYREIWKSQCEKGNIKMNERHCVDESVYHKRGINMKREIQEELTSIEAKRTGTRKKKHSC
ncbi:uncharacterized protein [Panulirus ornatus]|uniref:uncharacterized protein n=1 Tax=Panulirus ornatus TaxID=150431 RepID=UPI003A867897